MLRNLREMWKFRGLILALVGRHLRARYRGSFLGLLWSFLNPLLLLAVYSFVFQYYMRFDSVENYSLFLFTGLLPWIWFSSGLLDATSSISSGGNLITKAIFPAHILPVVSVLTNLVHFIFATPILLGFMFFSGILPQAVILWFPVIVFTQLVFLVGLSLLFSALNVHFRDVQHMLGNFLTLWFFLCPILYPTSTIPEKFRVTLYLNPLAKFTEFYQNIFLYGKAPSLLSLGALVLVSAAVFALGNRVFNNYREGFAELV